MSEQEEPAEPLRSGLVFATFVTGFLGGCALAVLFALQLGAEYHKGAPAARWTAVWQPVPVIVLIFSLVVAIRYALLITLSWLDVVRHEDPAPYDDGAWPAIAVIVPVYKERDVIERSLESLDDLAYPGELRVIVVLDGTDEQLDGTPELIRMFVEARPDRSFIVLQKPNGGKASALNLGIAEANRAGAELVLCVDGDTIVSRHVLERMAVHFRDPGIVACAGQCRVRNWLGGSGIGEHGFPFWESLQALEFCVGHGFLRRAQSLLKSVAIIPGPCGMFRLSVLNGITAELPRSELCGRPSHPEHGPYEYDTLAEDCDLTLALLRWAWRNGASGISYEPQAVVRTEGRGKLKDLYRQRYRWLRGVLSASVKHFRQWSDGLAASGRPAGHGLAPGCGAAALVSLVVVALLATGRVGPVVAVLAIGCASSAAVLLHWLRTDREPASLLLLGYMIFESIIWPPFSVLGVLIFIKLALFDPEMQPDILLAWFVSLMVLDFLSAVFSVLVERESLGLIPFIFLMKPLYVITLDTCKLVAMLDVAFRVPAIWHDRYVAPQPSSEPGPACVR